LRAVVGNADSWFGLVQLSGQPTPADGWSWNGDGQALSYLNWQPGQPDDADGVENDFEQCAYIASDDSWRDRACSTPFAFSCESGP
jgi:hypothetical protein